jgi:palmitoyl-protein thioesterase
MIGKNPTDDQYNGFFMPIDEQITYACGLLSADPQLQDGFHAVGFSQVVLIAMIGHGLP